MEFWEMVALAKASKGGGSVPPEQISEAVDDWLEDNVDPETGYVLDSSLTMSNAAAPADKVGELKSAVNDPVTGLDTKAPVIIDTASGSVASFPDGTAAPLKKLVVNIEPVQEAGTPTPENPLAISGFTSLELTRKGKNLCQSFEIGKGINEQTGVISTDITNRCAIAIIPIPKQDTFSYIFSTTVIYNITLYAYDYQMSYIGRTNSANAAYKTVHESGFSLNTTGNANPIRFIAIQCFGSADQTANINSQKCQFETGNIRTSYEPYSSTTLPISWQSEAGTVYGGTMTINEDGTGELRKRPYYASYNGETLIGPWLSSMDVYSPGATPTIGAQVVDLGGTETVYQLTDQSVIDTLYGTNNIWADCGDVEVEYRADTKLYIQKINAPADDDMIADAQIASGKYFIVGGNLYLSTTTIPAGDTIIPGTNCTKTNLAEALNALNV